MNPSIERLVEGYEKYLRDIKPQEDVPKIHVDEIAAKVAAFYERIRGFIDYKEEHLLRKNFIDRVFRRRFFFKELVGNIGEPMIKEIIRSGRLPNDAVPEVKIKEVDNIIDGFIAILKDLKTSKNPREEKLEDWLTRITAHSIEECLFPPLKENLIAETMFWSLKEKAVISGAEISESDANLQLFIAVQRTLLRADEDQLNYRLLKFIYPNWNNLTVADRTEFVKNLSNIKDSIDKHLNHPLKKYFFRLCNKYNTIFYLFGDIVDEHMPFEEFRQTFAEKEDLEKAIKKVYAERYKKERSRLNRLAFLSVLSIFLSKIVVAFGIEIPIDFYITHEFSLANTLINVAFPVALMLVIVLSIKMPSEENEKAVAQITDNICYGSEKKGFGINIPKKGRWLTSFLIQTIYLAIFFYVFYFVYYRLKSYHFSDANIVIFAFFTSLVAATGVKVHNRANEINMEPHPARFFGFLIDIFALPFITVGKWGLATLNRLNILVALFNLIIELPFQVFVQFIENFRSFIKSKKEEMN